MNSKFFLYRFLDSEGTTIYIGRTNSIDRRLNEEHFTDNGNIPVYGYDEVDAIEYTVLDTYSQQIAYEAILISSMKPRYNIEFNDNGSFAFDLPTFEWKKYDCDLSLLKKKNLLLHNAIENVLLGSKKPLNTGLYSLDRKICIYGGSVTLFASFTQGYKTALATNICNNLLMRKNGETVLYINLKESNSEIIAKLMSINSCVDIKKIYNRDLLSKEEWDHISVAADDLAHSDLYFSSLSINDRTIYDVVSHIPEDFSLVIVDDVYGIDSDNIYGKDKTHNIMRIIKATAVDKDVPIIVIAPVPRNNRVNKRPLLSDLDYDSLISYSDNILLLYHDQESDGCVDRLEVIVAKNNTGETGTVALNVFRDMITSIE